MALTSKQIKELEEAYSEFLPTLSGGKYKRICLLDTESELISNARNYTRLYQMGILTKDLTGNRLIEPSEKFFSGLTKADFDKKNKDGKTLSQLTGMTWDKYQKVLADPSRAAEMSKLVSISPVFADDTLLITANGLAFDTKNIAHMAANGNKSEEAKMLKSLRSRTFDIQTLAVGMRDQYNAQLAARYGKNSPEYREFFLKESGNFGGRSVEKLAHGLGILSSHEKEAHNAIDDNILQAKVLAGLTKLKKESAPGGVNFSSYIGQDFRTAGTFKIIDAKKAEKAITNIVQGKTNKVPLTLKTKTNPTFARTPSAAYPSHAPNKSLFPAGSKGLSNSGLFFNPVGHKYFYIPDAAGITNETDRSRIAYMMSDPKFFNQVNKQFFGGKFHSYQEMVNPQSGVVATSMSDFTKLPDNEFGFDVYFDRKNAAYQATHAGQSLNRAQEEILFNQKHAESTPAELRGTDYHKMVEASIGLINSGRARLDNPKQIIAILQKEHPELLGDYNQWGSDLNSIDKMAAAYYKNTPLDDAVVLKVSGNKVTAEELRKIRRQEFNKVLAARKTSSFVMENGELISGHPSQSLVLGQMLTSIYDMRLKAGLTKEQAATSKLVAEKKLLSQLPNGQLVAGSSDIYDPAAHLIMDEKYGYEHAGYSVTVKGYGQAYNLLSQNAVNKIALLDVNSSQKDRPTSPRVTVFSDLNMGLVNKTGSLAKDFLDKERTASVLEDHHRIPGFLSQHYRPDKFKFVQHPYIVRDEATGRYSILAPRALMADLGDGTIVRMEDFEKIAGSFADPQSKQAKELKESIMRAAALPTGATLNIIKNEGERNGMEVGSQYGKMTYSDENGNPIVFDGERSMPWNGNSLNIVDQIPQTYGDLLRGHLEKKGYSRATMEGATATQVHIGKDKRFYIRYYANGKWTSAMPIPVESLYSYSKMGPNPNAKEYRVTADNPDGEENLAKAYRDYAATMFDQHIGEDFTSGSFPTTQYSDALGALIGKENLTGKYSPMQDALSKGGFRFGFPSYENFGESGNITGERGSAEGNTYAALRAEQHRQDAGRDAMGRIYETMQTIGFKQRKDGTWYAPTLRYGKDGQLTKGSKDFLYNLKVYGPTLGTLVTEARHIATPDSAESELGLAPDENLLGMVHGIFNPMINDAKTGLQSIYSSKLSLDPESSETGDYKSILRSVRAISGLYGGKGKEQILEQIAHRLALPGALEFSAQSAGFDPTPSGVRRWMEEQQGVDVDGDNSPYQQYLEAKQIANHYFATMDAVSGTPSQKEAAALARIMMESSNGEFNVAQAFDPSILPEDNLDIHYSPDQANQDAYGFDESKEQRRNIAYADESDTSTEFGMSMAKLESNGGMGDQDILVRQGWDQATKEINEGISIGQSDFLTSSDMDRLKQMRSEEYDSIVGGNDSSSGALTGTMQGHPGSAAKYQGDATFNSAFSDFQSAQATLASLYKTYDSSDHSPKILSAIEEAKKRLAVSGKRLGLVLQSGNYGKPSNSMTSAGFEYANAMRSAMATAGVDPKQLQAITSAFATPDAVIRDSVWRQLSVFQLGKAPFVGKTVDSIVVPEYMKKKSESGKRASREVIKGKMSDIKPEQIFPKAPRDSQLFEEISDTGIHRFRLYSSDDRLLGTLDATINPGGDVIPVGALSARGGGGDNPFKGNSTIHHSSSLETFFSDHLDRYLNPMNQGYSKTAYDFKRAQALSIAKRLIDSKRINAPSPESYADVLMAKWAVNDPNGPNREWLGENDFWETHSGDMGRQGAADAAQAASQLVSTKAPLVISPQRIKNAITAEDLENNAAPAEPEFGADNIVPPSAGGIGSAGAGGVSTGVGSITIDSPLAVYINGVEIGSSKVSSGGNASAVWGDEGVVLDNDSEDALKAADSIYNQKLGSYRGNLSSIAKLVRERNKLKTTSYSTGSEQEANRLSAIDLIQNQINDIARTAGRQVSGISSSDVRRSVEGLSSEFNEDRRSDRDRLAKNADEKAKAIDSAMVEAAKEYQRIQDEITTTLKKQLTIKEALAKLERSPEKNAKEIGDQKQLSQILDDRYKRLNAQAEKLGVSPSDKDRILTGAESERSYDYYESMARMDKARNGGLTKDDRVALSEYRQILKDQSSYQNEYLDIQKMLASDRRVNTDYRTRKSYQDRAAEVKQLWGEKTEDASLWESQYGEIVKNNPEMAKAVEGMMGDISDVNRRKSASRLTKENGAVTLFQNLKTSFHGLLNQFTQFGAAYKILGMVQTGIQNVVTAATNLDKAMTNIRIVTGDSREEAVKYMKSLSGLAGQLSVTTQEVASAADDWLRQGYSISDTNALITDSIHLSVLGLVSQGEATSDLTSIMKGYKLSVNEVATAVDKLTAVDMASASSAGGIAQALEQVANVANTAGVSLDQTIGMISTISDVTQREPSSVGQALRTMIARFSNVKAGVYGTMNVDSDNAEATENVNDIEKVLKKVGIQVRSSELDFRSFSDVLSDVADKWDTLDDVSKKAIATSVAGVRQSEQFYALMNNWDKYQKLTEVSANSAGTAEKKYLSYTEQLEAAQKRLQAAWESLAQNVDLNKFLTGLDNLFADAVKNLPIVLRYVLRFFATMQAYKIPTLLGSAKSFLFDAGGLIGGRGQRVRNYLGGSHGYDAQLQESKVGTIGGGLFDKTPTGQLIKALKENTAAQQGNTTATQQNTSVKNEGSLTAGLPQEPYNMSAPAGSKWDPALNNGKGGYRDIATGRMVPGQYDYAKAGYITNPEDALTDSGYIFIGDTKTGVGKYVTQKEDGSFVGVGPDAKTVEMSLKDKMQYERRVNKQTKGNSAAIAATVASGIVSAALTAQTSGQWENKILGTTEDREYSDDTKATIRGLTGIGAAAGGIAGALIAKSPTGAAVGSQLGGGLMDFLSNKIGPYLDRESFARKDLVEIGEKGLTVMANIKSSVTTLSDLADENLNSTNYESAVSARNNILKQLFSDGSDESRGVFENYLAQMGYSGTLYDMTGNYLTGTSADRKNLSNALTVAQRRTSSNEYMKSQAENIKEQQDALDKQWIGSGGRVDWETIAEPWSSGSLIGAMGRGTAEHLSGGAVGGTGADMWGTAKSMENLYRAAADKAGLSDKLNVHNYQTGWEEALNWLSAGNISQHETEIDTSAMSLNEKDDFYKSLLAEAQKEGNADLINSVSDILDNLKSIKEKQGQIYDEVNEQNVDAAVLTAGLKNSAGTTTTSITSMTTSQLKNLGIDKIRDMVAQELMANGGLAGHDIYIGEGNDRVMTDYAKNLIDSTLKQYSSIYGVVSGESYKLSEIFDLAEGTADEKATKLKIEEEFASAIGTTIDKLSDYASKYGDLTLGDFLSTPADLRTNLESYAKILNEIGSATGLTNETMESIISKYPDLIEYLGDTATLTTKLLGKMGQTSDLYSSGTMSSILGSSSVFDTLVSAIKAMGTGAGSLYDAVESDKVFGNASSLSDILTWLGSGSDLAKRVQEVINKVLNFNVDVKEDQTILNDVISYQTKMMDKQITNLNDQKEALSKINSQREYGNKLIEAQLKLEDAQKKKLVYREGVGFTYESDQAAIKEAQDALDELDVTKQQDLLQTEIDQLTSEKELLSDLANDSELKNLKEIYESWAKSNGVINTDQAKILTTITQLYNNFASLNVASAVSSGASTSAASASAAKEKMDTAWKNYQANSTSANLQAWQEAAKAYMNSGSGYSEDNMSEEQRTAYEKAIYSGKTYTFTDHDGKRHIATSTDPLLDSSDDGSNALKYAQSHDDVFVYSSAHKNGRSVSQLYSENYDSLSALLGALYKEEDGPLLLYADGKYIAYTGEQVLSTKVSDATGDTSSQFVYKAAALGSYGLPGGQTLLNEKGTEAIVTPYGTLTSLPSGTGVVPADLTQKLYDLSMVSPSILNALGAYKTGAGVAVSGIGGSSTDESLNINSLTMNVTAGSDFDADAFAEQLKQQAALTKRNH